jgi:tetratricopeptide (TPR) repeat protein
MLIGYACLMQGNLERAAREYRAAVAVFDAAHRPRDVLEAEIGLGRVYTAEGRVDVAREAFGRALNTARSLGDRRQEADCWNNLGSLELERGDLARAAADFRRSYDIKRADGSYDVASPAGNVALANTLIGRYAAAESVLVDAVRLTREWNQQLAFASLYRKLAELRLAQDRPRGAASAFRRALALGNLTSPDERLASVAGLAIALAR